MALSDDLRIEISDTFRDQWQCRDGIVVPIPEALHLSNDAVRLDATVLYADMSGSTYLVDTCVPQFAAEIYKAFLLCAGKVIRSEGGIITAYDGDRVMAVFLGASKNTAATRAALKINYAVKAIANPLIANCYQNFPYAIRHVAAVDTSSLFVARTGFRGANDLVWVGRAANYAAKIDVARQCIRIAYYERRLCAPQ